jgi:hypothetical protein
MPQTLEQSMYCVSRRSNYCSSPDNRADRPTVEMGDQIVPNLHLATSDHHPVMTQAECLRFSLPQKYRVREASEVMAGRLCTRTLALCPHSRTPAHSDPPSPPTRPKRPILPEHIFVKKSCRISINRFRTTRRRITMSAGAMSKIVLVTGCTNGGIGFALYDSGPIRIAKY